MENIITTSTCSSSTTITFLEEIKPKTPLEPSQKGNLKKRRHHHHNAKKIKVEKTKYEHGDEEEEEVEVEEKIIALQRIVPGGESLGADKLFQETADYILALQSQVKALKFLTSFVEGNSERKLGG